ncbi:lipid-A-disaccharide synthase [Hugenholtzia roseola]|uniref:lipid-A-disaccharide synthase n=1 Tax=Hugenholtzia roseola TaxID=1002 RepID=UPI001FE1FFD4|nr:lipid-A-disaccharide synthase [Hugenholtzia roseola]
MMKFYLIAGEASGDLHAANLVAALKTQFPTATFRGYGGEKMQQAGVTLVRHYAQMAFMGFVEVLRNLPTILSILSECKKDLRAFQPDALILVDYPGFNMRIAKFAKQKLGLKVFYYILPKVWAWNQKRALALKRDTDALFSILPFEIPFFAQYQVEHLYYVGNPLFDAIQNQAQKKPPAHLTQIEKPIIALLPGSRKQEVRLLLPQMLKITEAFPDYQFIIAGVIDLPTELYYPALDAGIPILYGNTYHLLQVAKAAVVASGTATLETALFDVPQVVVYQVNPLTYHIGKHLIRVPFISLVNLIAEKKVVSELIQKECNPLRIKAELARVLHQDRAQILADYRALRQKMQTEEVSLRTAHYISTFLKESDKKS